MQLSFFSMLPAVVIASTLVVGCVSTQSDRSVDKDRHESQPPTHADEQLAGRTYGTVCYSVQILGDSSSASGCRTQDWEKSELHALADGEFVFPDPREILTNAWDQDGFLRSETANELLGIFSNLPIESLRDMIGRTVFTGIVGEFLRRREFGNIPEMQYWARFCATEVGDACLRSPTAASWETNVARVVFEPAAP